LPSAQDRPAADAYTGPLLKPCSHKNPQPCVDKPPVVVHSVEPQYSVQAHNEKVSGTVVLLLVVGTDGLAHVIRVVRPLGSGLDEAAVEAVKQFKFKPAQSQRTPVPAMINIEVPFRYR